MSAALINTTTTTIVLYFQFGHAFEREMAKKIVRNKFTDKQIRLLLQFASSSNVLARVIFI